MYTFEESHAKVDDTHEESILNHCVYTRHSIQMSNYWISHLTTIRCDSGLHATIESLERYARSFLPTGRQGVEWSNRRTTA